MKVCYNKLWKLLIDKGMKKSQLRVAVGASKSTFAKLGKNETDNTFQIEINFDDDFMYGRILSQSSANIDYTVFNSSVSYVKREEKVYQIASVCRTEKDKMTGRQTEKELYVNQCEIAYKLPDDIKIEERGV